MILDSLKNASLYTGLGDRFAIAFDFLSKTDFSTFPDGKVELKGDDVFAIAQTYKTKGIDDSN